MSWKTIKILIAIITVFSLGFISVSWRFDELEKKITVQNAQILLMQKDINRLEKSQAKLVQFQTWVDNEFESTWKSFASVRQNFQSIGYTLRYGDHLLDKDKDTRKPK